MWERCVKGGSDVGGCGGDMVEGGSDVGWCESSVMVWGRCEMECERCGSG